MAGLVGCQYSIGIDEQMNERDCCSLSLRIAQVLSLDGWMDDR